MRQKKEKGKTKTKNHQARTHTLLLVFLTLEFKWDLMQKRWAESSGWQRIRFEFSPIYATGWCCILSLITIQSLTCSPCLRWRADTFCHSVIWKRRTQTCWRRDSYLVLFFSEQTWCFNHMFLLLNLYILNLSKAVPTVCYLLCMHRMSGLISVGEHLINVNQLAVKTTCVYCSVCLHLVAMCCLFSFNLIYFTSPSLAKYHPHYPACTTLTSEWKWTHSPRFFKHFYYY